MLKYHRINISEDIDTTKTVGSREYTIFYYCYFFKINFRFQPKVYDGCHDMIQISMSFNDFVVFTVERNNYRINFWFRSKSEAVDRKNMPIYVNKVDNYDY